MDRTPEQIEWWCPKHKSTGGPIWCDYKQWAEKDDCSACPMEQGWSLHRLDDVPAEIVIPEMDGNGMGSLAGYGWFPAGSYYLVPVEPNDAQGT